MYVLYNSRLFVQCISYGKRIPQKLKLKNAVVSTLQNIEKNVL